MVKVFVTDLLLNALVKHTPGCQKDGAEKSLLRIKALRKRPVNIW